MFYVGSLCCWGHLDIRMMINIERLGFLNLSFAQWNGSLVCSVICSWPRYEAVCRTPANSIRNTLDKTRGPNSNTSISSSTQVKHTKVTRHAFLLIKLAILVWGQPKPVSKSKKAPQGTFFMSMRLHWDHKIMWNTIYRASQKMWVKRFWSFSRLYNDL